MSVFMTVMTWVIGLLLTVSALLTILRIVRGPSVLDRVVASDVLVAIVVVALGAHAGITRTFTTLPIIVTLSLVGFMGAVAVARFVARDTDETGDAPTLSVAREPESRESEV